MASGSLDAFLYAERMQESGGNYSAVNASSGALGAYQVMPANVASWTERALGHSLTPAQFLASPSAQNAVATTILGGYFAKYGAAGAAAMWYSGQPDPNASFGDPPVSTYVADVLKIMGGSAAASAGPTTGGTTGSTTATDDASTTTDCLWSINLPGLGSTCILTQGEGRAITGALLLAAGAVVGAAGLVLLAAYGLKRTGVLQTAAAAAGAMPGGTAVAGRLVTAHERVTARPKSTAQLKHAKDAEARAKAKAAKGQKKGP